MTHWACASCGGDILAADDGWVEWVVRVRNGRIVGRDPRLVHSPVASPRPGRCQFDERTEGRRDGGTVRDMALPRLMGSDGLRTMRGLVERGEWPRAAGQRLITAVHG
jgi:hypothetical protein